MGRVDVVGCRLLGKCYDIGKRPGGVGRVAEVEGDLCRKRPCWPDFLEFDGQPVLSDDPSGTDLSPDRRCSPGCWNT
ncbi:MAG: hypothetical protein ACLR8Y_15880 [Alistipes indistinctus]